MYFLLLTCFFLSLVFQVCEVGMIGKERRPQEANGEAVDSGDGRVVELMQSMRGSLRIMA